MFKYKANQMMPENETDANETFDCYLNIYICVVCFDLVIFFYCADWKTFTIHLLYTTSA